MTVNELKTLKNVSFITLTSFNYTINTIIVILIYYINRIHFVLHFLFLRIDVIVHLPVQDVHLDVVSAVADIVKKVVIVIIEIEKGKEQEKENVIAVIVNVNVEKGIEQFVKENENVTDADKEREKTSHLEEGNLRNNMSIIDLIFKNKLF